LPPIFFESADRRDLRYQAPLPLDHHIQGVNAQTRDQFFAVEIGKGSIPVIPEADLVPDGQIEPVDADEKINEFLLQFAVIPVIFSKSQIGGDN
jgi:hypothetical protein